MIPNRVRSFDNAVRDQAWSPPPSAKLDYESASRYYADPLVFDSIERCYIHTLVGWKRKDCLLAKLMRAARGLAGVSIDTLHAELRRRQTGLKSLQTRYAKSAAKTARLAAQIEALGGSVSGGSFGRRTRPKNEMSLIEALASVLKGKEMSVTNAAGAVLKSGYRTGAANFRTMVNQALIKSNRFKKVSRGVYTAK